MSERCTYVVYVRTWLGGYVLSLKKKNSHRFRAYETFGELGEQWSVLHWVISKNSISIFWMQWQSRKWFFTTSLTFMMSEIPGRIEKWPQISNFITSSFNGDTLSSVFFNFQKKWLDYLRGDFFLILNSSRIILLCCGSNRRNSPQELKFKKLVSRNNPPSMSDCTVSATPTVERGVKSVFLFWRKLWIC